MEALTDAPLKILLVEDNDDDALLLKHALRETDYRLTRVDRLEAACELLASTPYGVVLLDLSLPDCHGFETFARMRDCAHGAAIIVLTGLNDEELGLKTVHHGAQDYLVKGAGKPLLLRAIRYAYERHAAQAQMQRIAEALRLKNQQVSDELQLASEIQRAILPKAHLVFSGQAGTVTVSHRYSPAGQVGGDFLDIAAIGDDSVGVLICDVMGHGVRAALVTAMLRTLVNDHRVQRRDPSAMLLALNAGLRSILKEVDSVLFVTAFYAVVNASTGTLRYASAGHPAPLWCRVSRAVESLGTGKAKAPALGIVDLPSYGGGELSLTKGERVLFFTDGLFEIEPAQGTYGYDDLKEAAAAIAALPAEPALDTLLSTVAARAADGTFSDDVCIAALDYL